MSEQIKAKDLAAVLMQFPEAIVEIHGTHEGCYGTGTPFTEDEFNDICCVFLRGDKISIAADYYLSEGQRIFPPINEGD